MLRKIGIALALTALLASPLHAQKWQPLPASAWRGYLKPAMPAGWKVIDGALTRVAEAGDIITKEQFANFELELEWKISPGGNSGIFFHVVEDPKLEETYFSGPEYQILDNHGHADGKNPLTSAASNFAVDAPVKDLTRKVGAWNKARLVVRGPHVEHWLNGIKVVEYEMWTPEWNQRVAASKFKTMPAYGTSKNGHIALQDHGNWVAFRNIRIRRIK